MGKREAIAFKQREEKPHLMQVTREEIDQVKRDFILANLSLSPDEVGAIFGKSGRWAIGKVKDGVFVAVDGDARPGENGLQASRGIRITAESVAEYRESIRISPERWGE